MIRKTYLYENSSWNDVLDSSLDSPNTLVICFGSSAYNLIKNAMEEVYHVFTNSIIIGCSTAGEIYNNELYENSLSIAVIKFEKSKIKLEIQELNNSEESFDVGIDLANNLFEDDLQGIFILSDGLNVNGSQLTKGFNFILKDSDVIVTGGLAGDDDKFEKTWVIIDNKPKSNYVSAIGLYGDELNIAHGSQGGWSKFGIKRTVTKSSHHILYELDNKPALEVYKTYLGLNSKDLPASGLYYPLMIKEEQDTHEKVRTILAIDEKEGSITFAGDIPVGSDVMFMKASYNQLIRGANDAASSKSIKEHENEKAINLAISCVGRKLVLGQQSEEEIEAVTKNFSDNILQVGYYSYGEISPLVSGDCDLHNQTMTLTLLWECEND